MRKIVLVVGASSNLGSSVCKELTSAGHHVYAGYNSKDIPKETLLTPIRLDVTSDKSCIESVKKIITHSKKIDSVIYLAGISPSGKWNKFSSKDFLKVLDVNCVGVLRVAKSVMPYLEESGGSFISVSSLSGLVSFPNYSIYSASKFAVKALSTSLYHEQYPRVRVTCIFPGAIDFGHKVNTQKSARSRIPLLKLLLPLESGQSVSRQIVNVLNQSDPPAELPIGVDSTLLSLLSRLLPSSAWYYLQRLVWSRQK